MALQTYKFKNGITFTPVDLTTLTTPTGGDVAADINDSNKIKYYDAASLSWKAFGTGSGGSASLDTLAQDTAETAVLADYTQTGLEILATPTNSVAQLIHGAATFRLIHQSASTRSFKKTIAVDEKFRNRGMVLSLWNRSTALSADCTLLVRDETNNAVLLASTAIQTDSFALASVVTTSASATITLGSNSDYQLVFNGMSITGAGIQAGSVVISKGANNQVTLNQTATASATVTLRASGLPTKRSFSFTVPDNCASLSWTISALQETPSESYFDDISLDLAQNTSATASFSFQVPSSTAWATSPLPAGTITNATIQTYQWRQDRQNIQVYANIRWSGAGSLGGIAINALLPSGYTLDSSKLTPSILGTPQYVSIGRAYSLDNSTADYSNNVLLNVTAGTILISNQTNAPPFTPGNLDELSIDISVPVVGLSNFTTLTQSIPLTSAVLSTAPDSYMRLAFAAMGTTNTRIGVFSGPIGNQLGSDFTWIRDAALGDYFLCNREGSYTFMIGMDTNAAGSVGLSVDSVNLTTNYTTLPDSERLSISAYGSTAADVMSYTVPAYVKAGQKVRMHTDAGFTANANSFSGISITGQQSIKVLNPSSDQKIDIPTSELRVGGATGRGTTDTGVVRFPNVDSMVGDAFSVVNTAANGTVVTMLKDGRLSTNAACYTTTTGVEMDITRNQTSPLTSTPNTAQEILATAYVVAAQVGGPSWTGNVKKGDVFRIVTSAGISANATSNFWNLSFFETKISVALSNVTPNFTDADDYMELDQSTSYGSTATKIPRFNNITVPNPKGKFTYADSATNGASFTINEAGMYFFKLNMMSQVSTYGAAGWTKNENVAVTGTTGIGGLSVAQGRVCYTVTPQVSGIIGCPEAIYYGWCNKGDVLRPRTEGGTPNDANLCSIHVAKIGKPSFASVDITPFLNLKTQDYDQFEATYNTGGGFGSTNNAIPIYTARSFTNRGIIRFVSNSVDGSSWVAVRDCRITMSCSGSSNGAATAGLYILKNDPQVTTAAAPSIANIMAYETHGANNLAFNMTANIDAKAGDVIRVYRDSTNLNATPNLSLIAVADVQNIVSAATALRLSDYLVTGTRVTGTDPVALGQYRALYRATASNFALSDCTSLATPPSVANGMAMSGNVVYTSTGSATTAYVYRIFIGKNKNFKLDWFLNTGRTGVMSIDYFETSTISIGSFSRYDPTTGVLEIDSTWQISASPTARYLGNTTLGSPVANAYFDVTVFDTPFVSAAFTRKYAYIREQQPSGTSGGTFTAGARVTRVLNTLVDTSGIVNSLSGNAFTLQAGTYRIRAEAPGYATDSHQANLRNITDSTDVLLGTSAFSRNSTNPSIVHSIITGTFTITAAKSFTIQHQCGTTAATNGLGVDNGFGNVNIYTSIELEKLSQ